MKKNLLRIVFIVFILMMMLQLNSMAAVIVSTDKQVESNSGNVTISITSKQALGAYTLKLTDTAGLSLVSVSSTGEVSSDNKTITYASASGVTSLGSFSFKVPSVTTDTKYNVKFSITGMETPNLDSIANETNTAVITVKAPVQNNPTQEEKPTSTAPAKTETPVVEEPKFTSTNKTMYATDDINLRASWSTSSAATTIKKGTELTVTATSTNKVNGYVWYKVNYNGTTKYVASNLLTNTKPEEKLEEKKEEKSNNANLKTLTIENQELIPTFSSSVTSYTMEVINEVTDIKIDAQAENEKATVSINGNKDLKEGENTVTVSVSAEDGIIKIYEIKLTRLVKNSELALKNLNIEDVELDPIFNPEVYEYEVYIGSADKLKIRAAANVEDANVEILGNENFKDGENIVTIIVTSKDGKDKITYQITVNKLVPTTMTTQEKQIDNKIYLYCGIGAILIVALIIVVVYVIKHRKQEDDDYYYDDDKNEFLEDLQKDSTEEEQEDNYNLYGNIYEDNFENEIENKEQDEEEYVIEEKENSILENHEDEEISKTDYFSYNLDNEEDADINNNENNNIDNDEKTYLNNDLYNNFYSNEENNLYDNFNDDRNSDMGYDLNDDENRRKKGKHF